jgi:hypothetical protein
MLGFRMVQEPHETVGPFCQLLSSSSSSIISFYLQEQNADLTISVLSAEVWLSTFTLARQ